MDCKRRLLLLLALSGVVLASAGCSEKGSQFRGAFRKPLPDVSHCPRKGEMNVGDPLFLSPYLERGEADKARSLSEVVGLLPGVTSHSGYFTVNKTTDSNMFFWFFPAQQDPENAPVLLWLQGGPGASSLFGLFNELGPIQINAQGKVERMPITWNSRYSLIFIDNPVGTGYSFTKSGYATNEGDVARDLYSCLKQFFQVFDSYAHNDFYVTGESYAGKYVPSISNYIVEQNKKSSYQINFKGMAIGDGLVDPLHMNPQYGPLMRQFSVIDSVQQAHVDSVTSAMTAAITEKDFVTAFKLFDTLLNGDLINGSSWYKNVTGSTNYFNILRTGSPVSEGYYGPFIVSPTTRDAIHVGDLPYNSGNDVEEHLLADVMNSALPQFLGVVESGHKVMVYNGQLDIIVGAPLTERFLAMADWSGREAFIAAERDIWKIHPKDEEVAGYVRKVANLWQVVVRGAGHMVPFDQPERAFDLITRFIDA